jgi:hypothetical protein
MRLLLIATLAWAAPADGPRADPGRPARGAPAAGGWVSGEHLQRAELEQMEVAIAPLVEQVTGRQFDKLPPVVVADTARLERVLVDEQVHLLRRLGDVPMEEARADAKDTAENLAESFVGKYGFLDGNLYVLPGGVDGALATQGLDPSLARDVMELVIAHELTHALQDQQADLAHVVELRDENDAIMAVNCLVEGQAVWVQEQVGALLGLDGAVAAVARILGYEPGHPQIADDPERFYTSYVYGQGRNFVAWEAARGGSEAVWAVLADPPGASSMIVHPETYVPGPPRVAPERIGAALRRGRDRLVEPAWRADEEILGDYDVRKRLIHSDAPSELADRVVSAWSARGVPSGGFAGAELELIHFDSPADAVSYVEAMHLHSSEMLADAQGESEGAVRGFTDAWDHFRLADLAARELIALPMLDDQQMSTHWVARGPYVVQVVLVNAPPSEHTVAAQIERVLRSVDN